MKLTSLVFGKSVLEPLVVIQTYPSGKKYLSKVMIVGMRSFFEVGSTIKEIVSTSSKARLTHNKLVKEYEATRCI